MINKPCRACAAKKNIFNEKQFYSNVNKLSKKIAWFIGLFAADGNVTKNHFSLSQSKDYGFDMMDYVKYILEYKKPITTRGVVHSITFTSDKIKKIFGSLGIVPAKSLILKFPKSIINNKKLLIPFIRGYFEGDGSISVNRNIKFITTEIAGTYNFVTSMQSCFPNIKSALSKRKNIYVLIFTGQSGEDFLNILYKDKNLYEGRKYNLYKDYIKNISPYRRFLKYRKLKDKFKKLYKKGLSIPKISELIGICFQTLYVWKKQYETS